jgi:4-amino-4-deoxy-L-arabinose transferase-like glycosyltransferase
MSEPKHDALGKITLGVIFLAPTLLAGFYVLSGAWLSMGLFGILLAGLAVGIGAVGPYYLATGVSEYREVTAS